MSESEVIWHSIEKEGLPPNDCNAVLVSIQTLKTLIGDKPEVFEAVWKGRCWADTYEGYYNFEKSEFGEKYAQVTHWGKYARTTYGGLNMDGFEALTEAINRCSASIEQLANAIRQSETRCGYIKQKHNRPVYRKGAKLHEGHKRIMRTREGFRK